LDGGGLEVVGLQGDTLQVRYAGACGSCPTSVTGTLRFIDQTLKSKVDASLRVELVS
jgi:Fe-S cluster biogenesis protein NfuA